MAGLLRWTWDFLAAIVVSVLALVVAVDVVSVPAPVRVALLMPLVLVLPGYTVVSTLYPARRTLERDSEPHLLQRSLGGPQRLALSVGLSLVTIALSTFAYNFTSYGITPGPVATVATAITVLFSLFAIVARLRLPADHRAAVLGPGTLDAVRDRLTVPNRNLLTSRPFVPETGTQRLFNVLFVASVLVFAGSVVFVAAVPTSPATEGEFTEYYLLQKTGDGEFAAENFPESVSRGEQLTLYVGIENHEQSRETYTTVVLIQQVDDSGEQVLSQRQLGTFETTVDAGERTREGFEFSPSKSGETRVVFLLYKGDPPANPSMESAYRAVRLQFTVGGGGG